LSLPLSMSQPLLSPLSKPPSLQTPTMTI
jgi:hypothetical protein